MLLLLALAACSDPVPVPDSGEARQGASAAQTSATDAVPAMATAPATATATGAATATATATATGAATATATATGAATGAGVFLDRNVSDLLATLRTARFESARELGGISVSFKVKLADGTKCNFKPEIRGQRQRWQGEVAAWRIAQLLGLDADVPPSVSRRVGRDELVRVLEDDERTAAARERLLRDVPWDDAGLAPGSVTFWIPNAVPRALERETAWHRWLAPGATVDEANRPLAAQLSNLFVFDHVIGNWDRLSGGGFLATRDGTRIFFIDHNAGFYRPMPREARERLDAHFEIVGRFDRALRERLRALDAPSIRRALGEDGGGIAILTDDQIADVLARRDEVLAKVTALVGAHGEPAVLF